MEPVRWGILSTALIATQKVIPAMRQSPMLVIAGLASRDGARARQVAGELGIARAYDSYEALLADPDIEAVYNPLPNPMHVPLTLAAARAGKHVLCEKPMALTAAELDALGPWAGKVHIWEAFMVRHHPQWIETRQRVRDGEIGELRFVQVGFSYFNDDPHNIRNRADLGGGALYDIGCYAIVAGRWFFEAEPQRAFALMDLDPVFATDRTTTAALDFGRGRQLGFTVSTQAAPWQRVVLEGTRGRIEIEIPFNAPPHQPCRYWTDDATTLDGRSRVEHLLPVVDQYRLEAEAFSRAVRGQAPDDRPLEDARANMRTIDALFASARSGRFESL